MSLKIIMGNMFSGKTSELVRRLKRYQVIGKNILVINSSKDTRCLEHVLRTHDNIKFNCVKTNDLTQLNYEKVDVIAIDEAQFFIGLKVFVKKAIGNGKTVLLTGLDGDYKQEKIGEILECVPLADKVFKLTAMCMDCLLYTSPSPRDLSTSRMPSSA